MYIHLSLSKCIVQCHLNHLPEIRQIRALLALPSIREGSSRHYHPGWEKTIIELFVFPLTHDF